MEVSSDGTNWIEAAISGELANDKLVKQIKFDTPVDGKFIKITALSTYGKSAAQIDQFVSGFEYRLFEDISIDKNAPEATVSYSVNEDKTEIVATAKLSDGTFIDGTNGIKELTRM